MSEDKRFAAPQAAVADLSVASEDRLLGAHEALNRARLGFVVFLVSVVAGGFVAPHWAVMLPLGMLAGIVLAHVFLGIAASRASRSWVLYAVAPLALPVLGGLISFGILRSKVPYADD